MGNKANVAQVIPVKISKTGSLHLNLTSTHFLAGETVTGEVEIHLPNNIQAEELDLYFSGV